jgi:flagellar M-ring protein FliF
MDSLKAMIEKLSSRLKEIWTGLNLNQKVLISGALLLIVTAVVVSSRAVLSTNYEPLYTNLAVNDAAAMTAQLDELGVDYKLEDAGATIMVPAELKYETRLQLASAGLPQGAVGFEIFNETSFGETETDKRVKYQVALQGELTKTIQSLDKVEAAKVNLVIPQQSLYTENQKVATASVLIKNRFNTRMSSSEIQGIVHLVANSVEGLKPENVTVVDTNGNVLSSGLSESEYQSNAVELTQAQLALQRQYEAEMQTSVQSMLEHVVGPGKAVVRVSAELNFDEKESRMEIYSPLQDKKTPATFVRSDSRIEETSESTGQAEQGAVGTDTNIPSYMQTNPATESSSSERTERITNYEIDKEEILQRFAPGAVKRLTVAVIVDQELDSLRKDEIQRMVETAVGIDPNHPDPSNRNVSVTGMRFSQVQEPVPEGSSLLPALPGYAWILLLILALAVSGLVIRTLRLRRSAAEPQFEAVAEEEIKLQDLLDKELTPQEKERKLIREEVEKLIDVNPEDAANLIRTWLLEEGV